MGYWDSQLYILITIDQVVNMYKFGTLLFKQCNGNSKFYPIMIVSQMEWGKIKQSDKEVNALPNAQLCKIALFKNDFQISSFSEMFGPESVK